MTPWLEIASIILFASCFLHLSESIDFNITSFVYETKNILHSGDATPSSGAIELTRVDHLMRVGHVTYSDPVQIWDKKTTKLTDFTTRFTFVIDTLNQAHYGDAFSFFLAPFGFQIPSNSAGMYLGLFNTTTSNSPLNQLIHVEFDAVVNIFDPPYTHVGININSVGSVNSGFWNIRLHSGDPADVSVSYNATTQMLTVSLSYGDENTSTNLSYKVDLRDYLPEFVTIGFSGTTGLLKEKHILKYWEFSSSLKSEQKNEEKDNSKKRKLAVGLAVPLCVLVVGAIIIAAYVRLWSKQS
ncbi:hypothetical protein E3N88_08407 [Mikania micrantha]|uniref:Legume lectin domain-containing protein n=1 Tax=Mikania micrantha TaxID=192012 RepID=A0A5N6PI21_9ASTR|nr:hypothetical protein E3N88_08407 [Mikania micrantha]